MKTDTKGNGCQQDHFAFQFSGYMKKVVWFARRDYLQKNKREQEVPTEDMDAFSVEGDALDGYKQNLEDCFYDRRLYEAVHCLSPLEKSILYLHGIGGLSEREIAQRLGCSKSSVNRIKRRILRELRIEGKGDLG